MVVHALLLLLLEAREVEVEVASALRPAAATLGNHLNAHASCESRSMVRVLLDELAFSFARERLVCMLDSASSELA